MHHQRGFTLIELMIVVAITMILAAMATVSFSKYAARAKAAEAKVMMQELYRVEKTIFGDVGSYTDNLCAVDWRPSGSPRYLYGFTSDNVPAASGCNDTAEIGGSYSVAHMVDNSGVPLMSTDLPLSPVTRDTFTIGAVGNVDGDYDLDVWTLHDGNLFTNHVSDP